MASYYTSEGKKIPGVYGGKYGNGGYILPANKSAKGWLYIGLSAVMVGTPVAIVTAVRMAGLI